MSGEKLTQEIKARITELMISKLDEKYNLCYAERGDNLNHFTKQIQQAMDRNDPSFLYDGTCDWFDDQRLESAREIVKQIAKGLTDDEDYEEIHECIEIYFDTQAYYDVEEEIYNRDISDPMTKIIGNTKIRSRVRMTSNYEALPSFWDMGGRYEYKEYFKEMIDLLCLNPAKVKQALIENEIGCVGRFPNKPERNGKEAVKYSSLITELREQCSYCELTFMGMLPLADLVNHGFEQPDFIIVPKGNYCGMFGSWAGSGSIMGMELQRDLKVSTTNKRDSYNVCELMVDEKGCNYGYCIDEVYGYGDKSQWGDEFELEYKLIKTVIK